LSAQVETLRAQTRSDAAGEVQPKAPPRPRSPDDDDDEDDV
jgi:hypothetical protein